MTRSASERLRELDAARQPFPTWEQEKVNAFIQAQTVLMRALPLIADVVEAAEVLKEHDDNDPKPLRTSLENLYGTVAALREALDPLPADWPGYEC